MLAAFGLLSPVPISGPRSVAHFKTLSFLKQIWILLPGSKSAQIRNGFPSRWFWGYASDFQKQSNVKETQDF